MRAFRWIPAMVVSMALAGCATTANYEQITQSWMGATESDLIRGWGPPQHTVALAEGHRLLVYDRASSYVTPTTITPGVSTGYWHGPFWGDGMASPTTISGGQTVTLVCRTEFEVDNAGRVVNTRIEGNNCKAKNPEKDRRYRHP
jgi:hypothetical protein